MAGALIHILSGVLLGAAALYRGYGREFALAGFVGALFPDLLKYLILGIYYWNFDFFYMINTSIWRSINEITLSGLNLSFGFLFAGIGLLLYETHVVKEKRFWEVEELDYFLLIGIVLHLVIDLFWIESSWLL